MSEYSLLVMTELQRNQYVQELQEYNDLSVRYGLFLSEQQIRNLAEKQLKSLEEAGRVAFGSGVLKKLIVDFCDSPYLSQDQYEETVAELLDLFYSLKNELHDTISDEELLALMKRRFDTVCGGSLDSLRDLTFEDFDREEPGVIPDGRVD
jgi:hypothetical protein